MHSIKILNSFLMLFILGYAFPGYSITWETYSVPESSLDGMKTVDNYYKCCPTGDDPYKHLIPNYSGLSYEVRCFTTPKESYDHITKGCNFRGGRLICTDSIFVTVPCPTEVPRMSIQDWRQAKKILMDFYGQRKRFVKENLLVFKSATNVWSYFKKNRIHKEQKQFKREIYDKIFTDVYNRDVLIKVTNINKIRKIIEEYTTTTQDLKAQIRSLVSEFAAYKNSLHSKNGWVQQIHQIANEIKQDLPEPDLDAIRRVRDFGPKLRDLDDKHHAVSDAIESKASSLKKRLTEAHTDLAEKMKPYESFLVANQFDSQDPTQTEAVLLRSLGQIEIYAAGRRRKIHEKVDQLVDAIEKLVKVLVVRAANLEADRKTADAIHLESSSNFLAFIHNQCGILRTVPPSSNFFELPYLEEHYRSYKNLTELKSLCGSQQMADNAWMGSGCLELQRNLSRANQYLSETLPRSIRQYLIIARFSNTPDVKRLADDVESQLDKGKLLDAITTYDQLLRSGERNQ